MCKDNTQPQDQDEIIVPGEFKELNEGAITKHEEFWSGNKFGCLMTDEEQAEM